MVVKKNKEAPYVLIWKDTQDTITKKKKTHKVLDNVYVVTVSLRKGGK